MQTTKRLSDKLAFAALLAVLAGCSDAPEAKQPDDVAPIGASTASKAQGQGDENGKSAVQIDDKILKACGDLPTAKFSFDSADVTSEATAALDALARCFISGPLKGKGMKLVGHADPRGETEYNLALGQKRAGSVSEFLAKKGLEQSRMATSSKGEFEASGTDEQGWAADRKVEILLAE